MDTNLIAAINALIAREHQAVHMYAFFSNELASHPLPGYSNRMGRIKEIKEARKQLLINFLMYNKIKPDDLGTPVDPTYSNPIQALKYALCYDFDTTDLTRHTVNNAIDLSEGSVIVFLRGLVEEQVEEETTSSELLDRSRRAYNPFNFDGSGLGLIDRTLG